MGAPRPAGRVPDPFQIRSNVGARVVETSHASLSGSAGVDFPDRIRGKPHTRPCLAGDPCGLDLNIPVNRARTPETAVACYVHPTERGPHHPAPARYSTSAPTSGARTIPRTPHRQAGPTPSSTPLASQHALNRRVGPAPSRTPRTGYRAPHRAHPRTARQYADGGTRAPVVTGVMRRHGRSARNRDRSWLGCSAWPLGSETALSPWSSARPAPSARAVPLAPPPAARCARPARRT